MDHPTIWQPGFTLSRQQWSLLNRFRTDTQNTLARVVAGNRTPGSHLATLSTLHWLPVHKFIIATMTHKAIHTG